MVLDRNPTAIARVIYVDCGPTADGLAFDASLPPETDEVPMPPFEQLPASLDGLSDDELTRFPERAVPEPGSVMRETVRLKNDSRRNVPSTIIACSYPSEVMMRMARESHPMMAEVSTLRDLELVDLPTGLWPMLEPPRGSRLSDRERGRTLTSELAPAGAQASFQNPLCPSRSCCTSFTRRWRSARGE